MERKYVKLNDNYSHLSLGNIIYVIKEESKNKTSAIQSEVFCAIFNLDYVNESTINNYCIGSRSIGDDYKQIYIDFKNKYLKDSTVLTNVICNIITLMDGTIFNLKNINDINKNESLKIVCKNLYNISKNDLYVSKDNLKKFKILMQNANYYSLFIEMLFFAILEKKQPLYEDEKYRNSVEIILQNTDISVLDLQDFLLLELNEGISFSHSLKRLANLGNPYANYHLAVMEYRGEFSKEPRYDKAFSYFLAASEANHPASCWMIGNMIIKNKLGISTKDDLKKAISYFEKAKSLGNVAAINSLGLCYEHGYGITKNINKAIELYKEAASKHYVYAYNNLGLYYERNKNYEEAKKYFTKSADLGESFACNRMGEYNRGENNFEEAFKYYNRALESSLREITPWAYYNLAKYYYLDGNITCNISQNLKKTIEYFENSNMLIESLQELLFIYYDLYQKEKNDNYLSKIYFYKDKIEKHPKFNENIKKKIEEKLKNIKKRSKIILP